MQFDYVIIVRPDVMWSQAMKPHCFWDLSKSYRKWDWVLMMNRTQATQHLETNPHNYFNCRTPRRFMRLKDPANIVTNGFDAPDWKWYIESGNEWIPGFMVRQDKP